MNLNNKKFIIGKNIIIGGFLIVVLIFGIRAGYNVLAYGTTGSNKEIKEIEKGISKQEAFINKLKEKSKKYENNIKRKQKQITSLKEQVSVLDNRIAQKKLDIKINNKEIENTQDKIKKKNIEIKQKNEELEKQKQKIIDFIQLIYKNDQKSYLEVLIANNSFSEFFNYLTFTEKIEHKLKDILDELVSLKEKLENDKDIMEKNKTNLEELRKKLLEEKAQLAEEEITKKTILRETKYSETIFKRLLIKVKNQQDKANQDILQMEQKKRALINKQKKEKDLLIDSSILSWPVDPSRGITTYFHDPNYPFRYLFEHPAIDIRVAQGTPIKAPANAYVGRVRDNGFGYSYIMLIHDNGISTVYGHVNKILVKEDEFVQRGQIIGKTGGAPGTLGAGLFTTGAHLHFEIRLNGIPVNPLNYLHLP